MGDIIMGDRMTFTAIAFGSGDVTVEIGTLYERPAVFIEPTDEPGAVGTLVERAHPTDKLRPNSVVFTFPTRAQARAVADALVSAIPSPTPPADDSAVQRDIDSIFGMTDEEVIVDAGGPEAAEKIAEEGRAMLSRTLVMQRVVEAAREFQAARLRAKEVGRAPGWDGFRAMAAEWIDAERLESELFAALDALTDEAGT